MRKVLFALIFNYYALALVNVGTYVPNFLGSQADKEGGTTKLALNPFISIDYIFPPILGNYFNPEFGYVFNTDAEDETTHKTIFLAYNFDVPVSQTFVLRWGFTNHMDKIGGDGSKVELKNGTTKRDFYTANEVRTSYTSSLNLGLKTFVSTSWALRFDANIMSFLSSEKRGFNYLLSLNFN